VATLRPDGTFTSEDQGRISTNEGESMTVTVYGVGCPTGKGSAIMKLLRISGFAGILASVFAMSSILAATILCGPGMGGYRAWNSWAPDGSFSWYSNSLSDLGVSKVATFFNSSLILVGVLVVIFCIGFVKTYANRNQLNTRDLMLILSGGSFALVGVFTEDFGSLHRLVGFLSFGLFPMAILLIGRSLLPMARRTGVAAIIGGGLATLVAIWGEAAFLWLPWLQVGFAVSEIIELFIIATWMFYMGTNMVQLRT